MTGWKLKTVELLHKCISQMWEMHTGVINNDFFFNQYFERKSSLRFALNKRRDSSLLQEMFKLFHIFGRQYIGKWASDCLVGTSKMIFFDLFSPLKWVKKSVKDDGHFLFIQLNMKHEDWYSIRSGTFSIPKDLNRGLVCSRDFFPVMCLILFFWRI